MKRFYEVDFIKGVAVILMVIFHYFYFGTQMGKLNYNTNEGLLFIMGKLAHITFIFMVGINLVITRLNQKDMTDQEYRQDQYKRLLFIICVATFISFFTYLTFPNNWIKFGILHFIPVGIFLLLPLVKRPNVALMVATVLESIYQLIEAGYLTELNQYVPEIPAFILGLYNYRFAALDHFAIIKYLPVMALGVYTGNQIYTYKNRKIKQLNYLDNVLTKENVIVKLGKHSLGIYIAHLVIIYLYFSKFI